MQVSDLILVVILSAVTYRVGRFIALDSMFEGTRERVYAWLLGHDRFIWHKIAELLGCPYCITVWVAAATCFAYRVAVEPFAAPVFVWLAVSTGALIFWAIVDSEPSPDSDT
jgi:hypothetical protein